MLVLNRLHFSTGYAAIGTLSQAPLSGSASRELLEDVGGADWSPDGSSLAVVRAPQWRYRLEFPAGQGPLRDDAAGSAIRASPRRETPSRFSTTRSSATTAARSRSWTSRERRRRCPTGWESAQGLAWSASGKEIWFTATRAGSARSLYAVTPAGRERAVLTTPGGLLLQDISRDGRVLLVQSNARIGFFGLLPGETKERDLSGLEWSYGPRLSADAKTAVFTEQGEAGGPGYSVYLRKLDGSAAVRLGEGDGSRDLSRTASGS